MEKEKGRKLHERRGKRPLMCIISYGYKLAPPAATYMIEKHNIYPFDGI